ncbi:helix-turn-helix domain-containing protein [Mycobacterium sp. 1245852.3]|uniref:helix-turn-helix domain-containing protein n=1 Tax=Mycobacterium sp. 1245852.3 TaxID=1856860 RepID=UPI0009EF60C6|nr:helix-turn-helix domain-containing protein [Mycobacterium sp. 1245852.3]
MSWKALDWATGLDIDSAIAKFILHLLANKADENFSCYPSISTLMAESSAGRSTVLRALKRLEVDGLITRNRQFHDSGAQRATRYYLNHPLAPHLVQSPRLDAGPPGATARRAPSQRRTGGVSDGDPTGVSQRDPLNPTSKPPTEPRVTALRVLHALPWNLDPGDVKDLRSAVDDALAAGWTPDSLSVHLSQRPDGVRYPARVLARRLAELPEPPTAIRPGVPWCGECEDAQSRTINVTLSDGTEAAAFCPRCSPQQGLKSQTTSTYPSEGR